MSAHETQSHQSEDKNNPLGVQRTPEGGLAVAGQEGLPEGKASVGDKIIGAVDTVLAKATFDKAGVETAKLRMAGGKEAALGQARAPVEDL